MDITGIRIKALSKIDAYFTANYPDQILIGVLGLDLILDKGFVAKVLMEKRGWRDQWYRVSFPNIDAPITVTEGYE